MIYSSQFNTPKISNYTEALRDICYLVLLDFVDCMTMSLSLSYQVLQQAGRNPSFAILNKYWTPSTSKLNFDDFCEILKCEKKTEESELLRAFKKMDVNGDGYVSFSELEKALTTVSIFELFVLKRRCLHLVHAKVWAIIGLTAWMKIESVCPAKRKINCLVHCF